MEKSPSSLINTLLTRNQILTVETEVNSDLDETRLQYSAVDIAVAIATGTPVRIIGSRKHVTHKAPVLLITRLSSSLANDYIKIVVAAHNTTLEPGSLTVVIGDRYTGTVTVADGTDLNNPFRNVTTAPDDKEEFSRIYFGNAFLQLAQRLDYGAIVSTDIVTNDNDILYLKEMTIVQSPCNRAAIVIPVNSDPSLRMRSLELYPEEYHTVHIKGTRQSAISCR